MKTFVGKEKRKHEQKLMKAFIEKKCKEISFTFLDGKDITSVDHFKEMSENVGQMTQGSDSHKNAVIIDGVKYLLIKHWSNDGIGIWTTNEAGELNGCVGEIHFFNGKVYLQKYEVA